MNKDRWHIYDQLLATVPDNDRVERIHLGDYWLMLETSRKVYGLAQNVPGTVEADLDEYVGRPLNEIAALVKSWNFFEASLGLAAINAHLNSRKSLDDLHNPSAAVNGDAFDLFMNGVNDKRVAVVGHFPYLEKLRPKCRSLIILERTPREGDLPDTAAEYVLPEQDMVFITSTTFINKSLPRLLELCEKAKVAMVGPSTPMAPLLFDHGVDALSGLVLADPVKISGVIRKSGTCIGLFADGVEKVNLTKINALSSGV